MQQQTAARGHVNIEYECDAGDATATVTMVARSDIAG